MLFHGDDVRGINDRDIRWSHVRPTKKGFYFGLAPDQGNGDVVFAGGDKRPCDDFFWSSIASHGIDGNREARINRYR